MVCCQTNNTSWCFLQCKSSCISGWSKAEKCECTKQTVVRC